MGEPLNDKSRIMSDDFMKGAYTFQSFLATDVKSAVEWLKQEVNKLKVENALVKADVYELIDEAFEDVIK